MLVCDYIVERIDGDYAMLKRTDLPEEEAENGGKSAGSRKRSGKEADSIMNCFSIRSLNKYAENGCVLVRKSGRTHSLYIVCLEKFQKILREMDVHI